MMSARLPFPDAGQRVRMRAFDRMEPAFRRATSGMKFRRFDATAPRNMERRASCRLDAYRFGQKYFPQYDWDNDFLPEYVSHLQAAALVEAKLIYQKAVAAPRGIGKTIAAMIVVLWAILYGHVRFVAILSSSSGEAGDRLDTIQAWVLMNELLAEDFPELAGPVRACEGDPRRAKMSGFTWSKTECVFANGVRVMAGGLEGPVRGLMKRGDRPDFVVCDDIEDEDTVKSEKESTALNNRFRNEVLGLHEDGSRTIYLYLCTIISHDCISASVTDPTREPEWRGQRYKALLTDPDEADAWERYMEICRGEGELPEELDTAPEDKVIAEAFDIPMDAWALYVDQHKDALRYYYLHRESMDAGAVCLDARRRPLHVLYHLRATRGEHYWLCEIQQMPPENETKRERNLDVPFLRTKIAEESVGVMPAWANTLICSVDVGQNRLHWEMDAWDAGLVTSQVCRIGQESTRLEAGAIEMTEMDQRKDLISNAIRQAFERLRVIFFSGLPRVDTGEIILPSIVAVDCGGTAKLAQNRSWAWYEEVLKICRQYGSRWHPVKGAEWTRTIADRAHGRNWICEEKHNPYGRLDANTDYYKCRLMDGYEAPPRDSESGAVLPGTRLIFVGVPSAYLLHQTSEKLQERTMDGKPIERAFAAQWVNREKGEGGYSQNHWWDTGWLQYAAADYLRYSRGRTNRRPRRNRSVPRKEYS